MPRIQGLGIIGSGAIASIMAEAVARALPAPLARTDFLCTLRGLDAAQEKFSVLRGRLAREICFHQRLEPFLAARPGLVAECAGHGAVADHGEAILGRGIDLIVISIGALADDRLREKLISQAEISGAQLTLCPGALGGADILAAARFSGLKSTDYVSRKPPLAWAGTKAEGLLDLANITSAQSFYSGSARAAAADFPKNANVAAMAALAGAGLDATTAELIADPAAPGNEHELRFKSAAADVTIRIRARPAPDNPKTSAMAGYAMARAVLNRILPVVI